MAIYKPTELRDFLNELGISPKKVLSQNFLIDGNIVRKIVKSADVVLGDVVLEIGPGPGSLTEALLAEGATVVAVERDNVLSEALKRLIVEPGKLHIYCEDIMEFPIEETLRSLLRPGQKAKIIANLPYHLTTAIITQLIDMHELIESMTLMVQEEVARRFTAQTHTKDYGSLTVFLNFYASVKMAFKVSNQCFFPVPKVTSAVVVFKLKPPPAEIKDVIAFFKMTRAGYAHRRKVLRSSLKSLYDPEVLVSALEIMGMPLARPEELSLEQFM
ncbi:MAG: ribosomal RNA small subunit methyltransferase A, partial [Parachlamydiaceae bacterium]|nr:ribosomal RNA small subunit methyltransferase A [Parachlamydiaceae bacterium]